MWISKNIAIIIFLSVPAVFSQAADFTPSSLQKIYDQLHESVCILTFTQEVTDARTGEQQRQDGNAVALIVSPEGLVLSNGHLQQNDINTFNFQVHIRRNNTEEKYPAVLLEKPDDINISLLQIQSEKPLNLPGVRFRRNRGLSLGEPVALIGLMSENMDFQRCIQVERICAVLNESHTTYCLTEGLRLGFVTSPVVNVRGEAVGIVGFDLTRAEGGGVFTHPGHPLVFQSNRFMKYIDTPPDISENSLRTKEAWLGVFTQPLTEDYAIYWGIEKPGGLIVSTVVPGSPAASAEIKPGDIIRSLNGTPLYATQDKDIFSFTKIIRESEPNSVVKLKLLRDGKEISLPITLGERPRSARDAEEFTDEIFGLVVREITRDLRILLNLNEEVSGVIVRRVISGSPAHLAKIRAGVIIMAFGDHTVLGLDDFEKAVKKEKESKAEEVSVFARIGTATGFFRIRPRW